MNDTKAAAAIHPGDAPVTRPDLDALLSELDTCAWFTDGTKNGELVELAYFTRHRIAKGLRDAMAALAAERTRADQAERQAIEGWDEGYLSGVEDQYRALPMDGTFFKPTPNPYRAAPTVEQGADS